MFKKLMELIGEITKDLSLLKHEGYLKPSHLNKKHFPIITHIDEIEEMRISKRFLFKRIKHKPKR